MRDLVTTIAELAGAATICVGVFLFNTGAGLIAAGVSAVAFGYLGARQ